MKVGDTLYAVENNRKNGFKGFVTVSRIGRKYFYLEEFPWDKFDISTLKDVKGGHYATQIYRTEQEYLDKVERDKLFTEMARLFSGYTSLLTLEQLRQIKSIIDDGVEK